MSDWYDCIEEPVRDLVKMLRNNGINTINSCGHEMYIQVELLLDGQLHELHRLLFDYLIENDMPVEYDIETHLVVKDGWLRQYFTDIKLPKPIIKE